MRILRLASKAGLLGVLWGIMINLPVAAQNPAPSQVLTPSEDLAPVVAESPPIPANSQAPAPSSASWFDKLFNEKLPVAFGFQATEAYSDNIYFQTRKTYDYITDLSPSLTLTLGQEIQLAHALDQETMDELTNSGNLNYLNVTYSPTLTLYQENPHLDVVDENADAVYSHLFGKLTLSLEQQYQKLSQPTIQINAQGTLINRDIFTTTAHANYIYSDKLSTYGTLTQTVNHYITNTYTDNTEWAADYYFLYQLFPKLSVGLGPRIGWDDVTGEPNQAFQAALAHVYFLATGKFSVSGAGGAEVREYQNDATATEITPIVEGTATYKPFDSMTLSLDGERHRIVANGQAGSDYTASVASLNVRQRLFQVVYFTLSGGYENDQYTLSTFDTGGLARDDNIFYSSAGLEWTSYRGITLHGGYEYVRDDSNYKIFTFTENRFSVSAGVKY